MRQIIRLLFAFTLTTCGSAAANAGIIAAVGPQGFAAATASENFQGFDDFYSPPNPFSSGGFTFLNGLIIWPQGNTSVGFPTRSLYQNGGINSMLQISLSGGADFQQLQFDVGNGAGRNPEFLWIRAYNNGAPTGFDFDFTVPEASTLSIWADGGSQFDAVRIGAYLSASDRDAHTESGYSAASIDNVMAGTRTEIIPEPLTLALFGAGLAGVAATRRRKKTIQA